MPAYRDKRNGRWRYRKRIRLPDGRRERLRGTPLINTKAAAEAAEARHIQQVLNPTWFAHESGEQEKEVPTLRQFCEEFYLPKMETIGNKRGPNKPATLNAKRSHLANHLYPLFGEWRINEVDEVAVEDLKLALGRRGLSPKSINNVLSTLRNILRNAKKRKLIDSIPEVEWLDIGEQEFDFLDFQEADRLLDTAEKVDDWTAAITLAVKTGMRLGELRALRWEDIDLVKGQINVRRNLWRTVEGTPKNGKSRKVDLPRSAVAALKSQRARSFLADGRVFLDTNGQDYTIGAWRHGLYRVCRKAGLRRIGWHTLRHTYASHLVMRGASIRGVQELMGHSTLQMTLRYSHLAPGATRAAVVKLDEPAPSWSQSGLQVGYQQNNGR